MGDFKAIPTLSTSGFITNAEQAISAIFSYYLVSEHSQSSLYRGRVLSLPYRLEQYSGDERNLCEAIRNDLNELYNSSFDHCDCTVESETSPDGEDKFDVKISGIITHNGIEYKLGHVLRVMDNKLVSNN